MFCFRQYQNQHERHRMRAVEGAGIIPNGPVFYDSKDRLTILFQCYGSVWPRIIFPACINVGLVLLLQALQTQYGIVLSCSPFGHTIAGLVVSFLLVARVNSGLARYNECRGYIGTMYMATREVVQKALVYSRNKGGNNNNNDPGSKEWRSELAYRALLLLRTTVANIEYPSAKVRAYNIPELSGVELQTVQQRSHRRSPIFSNNENDDYDDYDDQSDSVRVPNQMAQLVRETICSQESRLPHPMPILQEMNLLASIEQFQSGHYGMRKFMTTPIPFPLIQMAHTLVMVYVFTLPLVFVSDSGNQFWEDCITTFWLTYGFLGLDALSVELDDPFGDDPNDFDVAAYAQFAVDDVIFMIYDADGEEWADALRYKMNSHPSSPIGEQDGLLLSSQSYQKYGGTNSTSPASLVGHEEDTKEP